MAKRIIGTDQAKADVRAIDQKTALQPLKPGAFRANRGGNVRQLVGVEPPQFRLRAQDHRVFFLFHQGAIELLRVRNRR